MDLKPLYDRYNNIRATLHPISLTNAQAPSGNKEETGRIVACVLHKGAITNPVTARFWMGRSSRASVVYCCVWIHTAAGVHYSGRGKAGGYGYHKASAALDAALASAGVKLHGYAYSSPNRNRDGSPIEDVPAMLKKRVPVSIGGVGEAAMRNAIESVTRAAGYRGALTVLGA